MKEKCCCKCEHDFKKIEEEKKCKFKVGDRVQIINATDKFHSKEIGFIFTIADISESSNPKIGYWLNWGDNKAGHGGCSQRSVEPYTEEKLPHCKICSCDEIHIMVGDVWDLKDFVTIVKGVNIGLVLTCSYNKKFEKWYGECYESISYFKGGKLIYRQGENK